jgi:hypothetical protein
LLEWDRGIFTGKDAVIPGFSIHILILAAPSLPGEAQNRGCDAAAEHLLY